MFADDGTQIGATKLTSFSRSIWSAEGQVSEFNIGHTRVSGPDGDCHFTVQVKIVAYEVVIARYLGPDCA